MLETIHDAIDRAAAAVADGWRWSVAGWAIGCEAAQAAGRWLRATCRREPLPTRPLVAVAVAVAGGAAVGPPFARAGFVGPAWPAVMLLWAVAGGLVLAWAGAARAARPGPAAWLLLAAIAAAAAGWGVARDRLFAADDVAWSLGEAPQPVALEGVVVASPRRLTSPASSEPAVEPASECVVAVDRRRTGAAWRPASGRVAVVVGGPPPDLAAGCRVRIFGRGLRPSPPLNPGEIDARARARAARCLSLVRCQSRDCLEVLAPPPGWSVTAALDRLRRAAAAVLERHLGPRAGLAAALLLGSREAIAAEDSKEFLVTGTIHILSISGLHVGILAVGLFRVLRAFAMRRSWAIAAVAACTGLYMLLVGAETPVVRATLVVWLSCAAVWLGRRSPAVNALAAAAIVVVVWHPPEVFRVGTQLSFLSTAVLVAAAALVAGRGPTADPIERLIESSRSPAERRLRRLARRAAAALVGGVAIWAVTAPIVAARFHVVSPVGLVLNPLVAPLVPLAMVWGFLCLLVAPVSAWLAAFCGAACDRTLGLVEWLVELAAAVPGGYVWVVGPPWWWVVGGYAWLVLLLVALPRERLARCGTWAWAACVWAGVGIGAAALAAAGAGPSAGLEVTVAALGHGCGVVVRSPAGRVIVCDAGRLGAAAAARRAMSAVLWSSGIARIDTLVVSHADADHFNAVPDLVEKFAVGEFVATRRFFTSDAPAVADLLRLLAARGVPVRCVAGGDEIPCDPLCRVRVVHHDPDAREDNETSLVVAVESAGRRLLLTGDLEGAASRRFVAGDPDRCDVLLAPHHGSATSLPPDIAAATAPEWVIVSGAGGGRWPEVARAYAGAADPARPARVVKTGGIDGDRGAVHLRLAAAGVTVRQYRDNAWVEVEPPVRPRPSRVATATPPRPGARSSG